ncbi:hypothetical protein IE4771_PB00032 (plasmid) [Rhizobium etli bv. mimosae str. IE4771]|uniref:Uncharacterized protein n=1 Tax=Rhizobium etli bv. mimosae str. IE4771 TaxID=1432050 RepID=A0A060I7A9_RHIET|nr:hypothetical protein IE4771_PB00032 [Rhizobium sp. IE4771]
MVTTLHLCSTPWNIDLSTEGNTRHIIETKDYGFTSGYDALVSVKINFNVATQSFDLFL